MAMSTPTAPYPKLPTLEKNMAILCLVLNVVFPGIGTIVAGVLSGQKLIGRGIAQLILALIIVGWIWAIIDGIRLLQNSVAAEKRPAMPA